MERLVRRLCEPLSRCHFEPLSRCHFERSEKSWPKNQDFSVAVSPLVRSLAPFEMTEADLFWLSARFWKALTNSRTWTPFRWKQRESIKFIRRLLRFAPKDAQENIVVARRRRRRGNLSARQSSRETSVPFASRLAKRETKTPRARAGRFFMKGIFRRRAYDEALSVFLRGATVCGPTEIFSRRLLGQAAARRARWMPAVGAAAALVGMSLAPTQPWQVFQPYPT